jgi:hypothetical protein
MTKANFVNQLNQLQSDGDIHVQTASGVFVVSAIQLGEDGAIMLRATETPAYITARADYAAQRKAAIAEQPEPNDAQKADTPTVR